MLTRVLTVLLAAALPLPALCQAADDAARSHPLVRVFAYNDLGMHCADRDYSNFAILPPFNVVNAQVLLRGERPKLIDDRFVSVTYRGTADAGGSINTTSQNGAGVEKSNFWGINPDSGNSYVADLFGMDPAPDQGLAFGQAMPGERRPYDANAPQPFGEYRADKGWFSAPGVPILPIDDFGQTNPYPLMRVHAWVRNGRRPVAEVDVVLPVSDEADCQNCHALGEVGADPARHPDVEFVFPDDINDPNSVLQAAKQNILKLHDDKHATTLFADRPVLCAACHYSAALDLEGVGPAGDQVGRPAMSVVMHRHHGELTDGDSGQPLFPDGASMDETCYQCHPGKQTACLRGAMGGAGIGCQSCHGGMLAVGGKYPLRPGGSLDGSADGQARRPWLDEPRCQSCHTGDALDHLGGSLRLSTAYEAGDPAASPRLAANKRFAENDDTLYRESLGHGGVACEACHGSTHAIWPNAVPGANDNVTAKQLQGHAGTIVECDTCHTALPPTTRGPHGMHNVADAGWMEEHGEFYERNPDNCRACHGTNLEGTALARTAASRLLPRDDLAAGSDDDGDDDAPITLPKGTEVSCTLCHDRPSDDR